MNLIDIRLEPVFIAAMALTLSVRIAIAGDSERPDFAATAVSRSEGVAVVPIRKPALPSWDAYTLDWETFPTVPQPGTGDVTTVPLPGPLSAEYLSMLTTTNWPEATGDMTRKSIALTMILDASGVEPPVLFSSAYENEDWNTCPAPPSIRLFFTSVKGKYDVNLANANPTNYWWCCTDFGSWDLTAIDNRGAYVEASISDPNQWTDALGDSATNPAYTASFYGCVSNIAQIGLSGGGNCFYDTGVALASPDGDAVLHITDVEVY